MSQPRPHITAIACTLLCAFLMALAGPAWADRPAGDKHSPKPGQRADRPAKPGRADDRPPASPAQPVRLADRYIVVLKQRAASARRVADQHGKRPGIDVGRVFSHALKGYSARVSPRRLARLKADRSVAHVVPDQAVHASGGKAGGSGQQLPTGVNRVDADLSGTLSGNQTGAVAGVAVAVLDSGSGPHPDLNVVGGKACTGTDFDDGNGHGTHVAGVIAARDDSVGVVGVAPGAPIYSVRVLGNNATGTIASLLCGIDWVTANASALGIKVAGMSLSTAGADDQNCGRSDGDPVHTAICALVAAGVTPVAGAGNNARDYSQEVPAAYDEVLTVTAISDANGIPGGGGTMPSVCAPDVDDTAADFSNFAGPGDAAHTIAAPGKCLYSTWRGGTYKIATGTSMAAPHVAGTAALCIALGPCAGLSPGSMISKLRADAAAAPASLGFSDDPRAAPSGPYYGYLVYAAGYQPATGGGRKR